MNWRYPLVFLLLLAVLAGALVLSARIPREAIAPRMLESAEGLKDARDYEQTVDGVYGSMVDHYADAVLLNIIWHFDGDDALRSVMEAKYYNEEDVPKGQSLWKTVSAEDGNEAAGANRQYIRYWHGSAAIVRALLVFLTLPQIYTWHAVLLAGLAGGLLFRLVRRKDYWPAGGLAAALAATSSWLVPLSLEYTWMVLVMLVQLHIVISPRVPAAWAGRRMFLSPAGSSPDTWIS